MKRAQKEKIVKALDGSFNETDNFYLLDFTGLTAAQSLELRRLLRENSCSFRVVKNRLAIKALKGDSTESLRKLFRGPTAIAFAPQNPLRLAKLLKAYSAQNNLLAVKGGILEGKFVSADKFIVVSNISSREELLGKIGFFMAYPLMKILRTWQAPLVSLGGLLSQLKSKK